MAIWELLSCHNCGHSHLTAQEISVNDGLLDGDLACTSCKTVYIFTDGVLDLYGKKNESDLVKRNSDAYSDFWRRGKSEEVAQEVTHEDVLFKRWSAHLVGKTLLDAGCGNGRQMHQLLSPGITTAVFVDVSDAILDARDRFRRLRQSHQSAIFIRCELIHIPLKDHCMDVVWSSGTVCLLPDQTKALNELSRIAGRHLNVSVLTEKTFTGKVYLWANWVKPIVNKIQNYDLLYWVTGVGATAVWLFLKLLWWLRIETKFLRRSTLGTLLNRPGARRRIQWALYDPVIIPRVEKHADAYYIEGMRLKGFSLVRHETEIISDYFFFKKTET